jgi:hypothetical protein
MTLYYSPGSCALAPHIALEEIGKPFSLVLVNTDQGEGRTPEFRRVNPKGRVPVLIDNDVKLTETPAILIHLGPGVDTAHPPHAGESCGQSRADAGKDFSLAITEDRPCGAGLRLRGLQALSHKVGRCGSSVSYASVKGARIISINASMQRDMLQPLRVSP